LGLTGSFSLLIRSENLDLDKVTKSIGLKPTASKKKGDLISKAMNQSMQDNLWQYQVKYGGSENSNNILFIKYQNNDYEVMYL